MKILNLYAGIGGNRKLWGDEHEITAIELNPQIAKIYQDFFPKDRVIVADAHQYLLEHFKEFEFIWSSPPCPTHSRARFWAHGKSNPVYPSMALYQEIIMLKNHCKSKFVVENVKPYYEPLIQAQSCGRHLFWANFKIEERDYKIHFEPYDSLEVIKQKSGYGDLDLSKIEGIDKRVILRNCVNSELGLHILNESKKELYQELLRSSICH
jgi:DNA (cytosine-5)-methyltransferase 1